MTTTDKNYILSQMGNIISADANGAITGMNSSSYTANLGPVGNVTITGGSNGQVLSTDGNGTLTWSTVVTNNVANANYSAYAGNITIAAQSNITSLGTLSNLTSNGTVNFTNASNVSLGAVGNIRITGGTSGQVLSTNGSGGLSWTTGGSGGSGTPGEYILFNNSFPPSSGYLRQGSTNNSSTTYPVLGAVYGRTVTSATTAGAGASALIFGGSSSLFVALPGQTPSTTFYTSTDGITWVTRTGLPINVRYLEIRHNGSRWVALAPTGQTIYSNDGITWTSGGNLPAVSGGWYGLAWNGTIWCAVVYNNTSSAAATSPDGITWTQRTMPNAFWYGIAWNGTVFCVLEYGGTRAVTSPDGITWTLHTTTISTAAAWLKISSGNGLFMSLPTGGASRIVTSPDGITWTERSNITTANWSLPVWNGTYWLSLTVGAAPTSAMTSTDGINWLTTAASNTLNSSGSETPMATNGSIWVYQSVIASSASSFTRSSVAIASTFTVPAATEPSGFQYWVRAA